MKYGLHPVSAAVRPSVRSQRTKETFLSLSHSLSLSLPPSEGFSLRQVWLTSGFPPSSFTAGMRVISPSFLRCAVLSVTLTFYYVLSLCYRRTILRDSSYAALTSSAAVYGGTNHRRRHTNTTAADISPFTTVLILRFLVSLSEPQRRRGSICFSKREMRR